MVANLMSGKGYPQKSTEQKKLALEVSIVKKLDSHYPNISKLIEYIEIGTAKTVHRYIRTPNATAYGFKPTPKQFLKMPQAKSKRVDNLYFVGQWVIVGGFSPSIASGYVCYEAVNRRVLSR